MGLRESLRDATSPLHGQLDQALGALNIAELAGYRQFLAVQGAALGPVEEALERGGVTEVIADWPQRSRRAALASDMKMLDIADDPELLQKAPSFDTPPKIWGAVYVLEGSRLGGAFLLKAVSKSTDPRVSNATLFLKHGQDQGLWQSFAALLEGQKFAAPEVDEAVGAAHYTFQTFVSAARAVLTGTSA